MHMRAMCDVTPLGGAGQAGTSSCIFLGIGVRPMWSSTSHHTYTYTLDWLTNWLIWLPTSTHAALIDWLTDWFFDCKHTQTGPISWLLDRFLGEHSAAKARTHACICIYLYICICICIRMSFFGGGFMYISIHKCHYLSLRFIFSTHHMYITINQHQHHTHMHISINKHTNTTPTPTIN